MEVYNEKVNEAFALFCEVYGFKVAEDFKDVGGYFVDYSRFGGYVIAKVSTNSCPSYPVMLERQSASEFIAMLIFAVRVKEATK